MATSLTVPQIGRRYHAIIVPIRFASCASGDVPEPDAPDIDDRGFDLGTSAGGAAFRGALVGITEGRTVRVRVVREDIEATADLYATSEDRGAVTLCDPPNQGGTARASVKVPGSGVIWLRGVAGSAGVAPVAIRIHLGTNNGPVLGCLGACVFTPLTVTVRPRFVPITDAAASPHQVPQVNLAHITKIVDDVWYPCGIRFVWQASAVTAVQTFTVVDRYDEDDNAHRAAVFNLAGAAGIASVYFVAGFREGGVDDTNTLGFAVRPDYAGAIGVAHTGMLVQTRNAGVMGAWNNAEHDKLGLTVAHEIGHFIGLWNHAQNRDAADASLNTMAFRQLMYPRDNLPAPYPNYWPAIPRALHPVGGAAWPVEPPRTNDTGYRQRLCGWLLTIKTLANWPSDGEVMIVRNRVTNPNW